MGNTRLHMGQHVTARQLQNIDLACVQYTSACTMFLYYTPTIVIGNWAWMVRQNGNIQGNHRDAPLPHTQEQQTRNKTPFILCNRMSIKGTISNELKLVAEEAPWPLLHCPQCNPKVLGTKWKPHVKYGWGLQLTCPTCHLIWTVCRICANQRAYMLTTYSLSRHQRNKHKDYVLDSPIPLHQRKGKGPASRDQKPKARNLAKDSKVEDVIDVSNHLVIPPAMFDRPQSQQFFQQEVNNNGTKYLCALANFGRSDVLNKIDEKGVNRFIKVAQFSVGLTRPQREDLAGLFGELLDDEERPPEKMWHISVPRSPNQMRSTIYEGKNSLLENLPYPSVNVIGEYAYIKPSQCIKDLFAHGHMHGHSALPKFEKSSRVTHGLGTSIVAKKFLPDRPPDVPEPNFLYLSFWSDGFEPNYSKLNRGSAWLKTMTIHTNNPEAAFAPITHVYPIAVGPKGNDHDTVEKEILKDLMELQLSTSVYDGAKKELSRSAARLVCVLQDQLERRACTKLMLGNSTYHAQFGVSFDFSQATGVLRPCQRCLDDMLESLHESKWRPIECPNCTNWAVSGDHRLLRFKAPADFPISETLPYKKGYLQYRRLDFTHLRAVAEKVHQKLVNKEWSQKQAAAYMKVNCLNTDAQAEIKECVSSCIQLQEAVNSGDTEESRLLRADQRANPDKYTSWTPPVAWGSGIDISQYPEIAMHHLFKGVASSQISLIQDWCAKQRKYEELVRQLRPLTDMCRNLRISWFRVEPYVGKELGGWVSENYAAFSRIMPWAYTVLEDLNTAAPYTEPDKPQRTWNKPENLEWLKARGLDTTGRAPDLQMRVAQAMADGPPPILPPSGGPVKAVQDTIVALFRMLSFLMGMKDSSEAKPTASRLIRIFMTYLYDLDENMQDTTGNKQKTPTWLSQYNHLCLLNIPHQVKMLGPLRNRWEGKFMGEGILSVVKPTLTSPNRKNWTKNLMANLLRQRAMLVLKTKNKTGVKQEKVLPHLDDFVSYPTTGNVISDFGNRLPLSVVAVETGSGVTFYAHAKQGVEFKFFKFEFEPDTSTTRLGLQYSKLEYSITSEAFENVQATASCVLLPYLVTENKHAEFDGYYTVIDSNWRTLTDGLQLDFPHKNVRVANDAMEEERTP